MQPSAAAAVFRDNLFDLVLGGGGVKGLAHAGSLKAAWERGIVFGHVYCVSIGSLVGAIYTNGYPVPQLADAFMKELDLFGREAFTNLFSMRGAGNIVRRGGAVNIRPFLRDLVSRYNLRNQPNLRIISAYWDFIGFKPYVFQGDDYDLATALHASCAMPPFVEPVSLRQEDGDVLRLVDGGLWHHCPHQFCDRPAIISRLGLAKRLPSTWLHPVDMVIHLGEMMVSPFKDLFDSKPQEPNHYTIEAGLDEVATFTFNLTDEVCQKMVRHGYEQACRVFDDMERNYRRCV